MTWRDRAACRGTDTETFFATAPRGSHRYDHEEAARDRESAKRVCRVCPVATECLEWAVEHGEHGVWGGTDENDRRRMRWGA